MEKCKWCNDSDLSNVPYGICYECGNHGPKYVETMFDPQISDELNEEGKLRFKRDCCDYFKQHNIKKCNCKSVE